MTLSLLNNLIPLGKYTKVIFPFNASRLPITKTGKVAAPDQAEDVHYTTLVYSLEHQKFTLLEFSKAIHSALLGYFQRHGSLTTHEYLLGRINEDLIRISIGQPNTQKLDQLELDLMKKINSGIMANYPPGKIVKDRGIASV